MTEERPPTKLYSSVECTLRKFESRKEDLQILRNPPYLEDVLPKIDLYTLKIREVQSIVREKISLELITTECQGHDWEHLFDTDLASVRTEFENWGLKGLLDPYNIHFINTGHQWTTISSARFKSQHDISGNKKSLDQIKTMRSSLAELYKPIGVFYESIDKYKTTLMHIDCLRSVKFEDVLEERNSMEKIEKSTLSKTNLIRKGVLSLSFVHSLVYQLGQSLDLSKNHPGD